MKNLFLSTLFILLIGLSTACGVIGGGIQYGGADVNVPFRDNATAYVVCGDVCLQQGQCGAALIETSETQVVLLNPDGPVTRGHNAFIQSGQEVELIDSQIVNMVVPASGDRYRMTFYQVRYQGQTGSPIEGWAHGMCIANRPNN